MNGEPLPVDSWARTRQTDLQIFVQETHHARRLDPKSYDKRDVETWDRMFQNWLIVKGRVRSDTVRFLWAMPEGSETHETMEGGVVVHVPFGAPQDPLNPNVSADAEATPIIETAPQEDEKPIHTHKKAKAGR